MIPQKNPPGTIVECKSCKLLIVWTRTEKGKSMPCDAGPHESGQFYLFRRKGFIEALFYKSKHPSVYKAKDRFQKLHNSHFATCPNAAMHRKSR